MAGLYGTVRPSNININNDIEMFYYYRPTRGTDDETFSQGFKKLDNVNLVQTKTEDNNIVGLFELRLPLDIFNKKGIYTVYLRPKENVVDITDVSVLAAYPDVKGVVFNLNDFDGINDLTGYRIDYLDDNGERTDTSRLITSCNRCEQVLVTISDAYPKATRYKLTDNTSRMVFCTVTPSTPSSFKPDVAPFIGVPGGKVVVSNTKFDPKLIEVEMVEHDAETLTYMIEGDQVRDRDNAIITTYNDEHEIYKQQDYYTVKDELGNPLRDIKRNRVYVDPDQDYDKTIDNV